MDAGTDAGMDASTDAGTDAGMAACTNAGMVAGTVNSVNDNGGIRERQRWNRSTIGE